MDNRLRDNAKKWLRGLDSNQNNQLQRLVSYQLDDPGEEGHLLVVYLRRGAGKSPWRGVNLAARGASEGLHHFRAGHGEHAGHSFLRS